MGGTPSRKLKPLCSVQVLPPVIAERDRKPGSDRRGGTLASSCSRCATSNRMSPWSADFSRVFSRKTFVPTGIREKSTTTSARSAIASGRLLTASGSGSRPPSVPITVKRVPVAERQLKRSGVRSIQNPEAILTGRNLHARPRHAVDQHDVALHSRVPEGVVEKGSVRVEHSILKHQRNVEVSLWKRQG